MGSGGIAQRLEHQLAVLHARPEVAVVGSRMHEVDEARRPLAARTAFAAGDVNPVLPRFNPIPNTSAAFRRDVVLALGGYANVAARAERAQIAEALAIRARALARRRTLRGASGLAVPALAWLTPLPLKRARRRALGQAP